MKIITSDAVYVQKNDIIMLNHTDLAIPASIFMQVFGSGIVIIDDSNRYEFEKFEEKDEIVFFNKLDWIVDYNEVKDLDENQIIEMGQSIAEQQNDIARKYNGMTNEERKKNSQLVMEHELLGFKMNSLRDFLWFKQGHIQFDLPDDISYPDGYQKTEEKGFQKILSIFKNKRKK